MSNQKNTRKTPVRRGATQNTPAQNTIFFFGYVIPVILAILAAIQSFTMSVPDATSADFLTDDAPRYLELVINKVSLAYEAEKLAAEAAKYTPTGELSENQICGILGIDPEHTSFSNDKLVTEFENGNKLKISDKSVSVNFVYGRLYGNGAIDSVWDGYNSEQETTIVIAGKKRSYEELAAIAMFADSVESVKGSYRYVDMAGTRLGFMAGIFIVYLILDIIFATFVFIYKKAKS